MRDKGIEKKQIGINMVANVVSYSANIIISFILTPFLINTLGKETYSFYPIANTLVSYMSVLINAMNSIASRFVTVSIVQGNKEEANKYYASVFAANTLMSIALSIPMIIIVIFLDRFMKVPINTMASIKILFALVFSSALLNIIASVFGIATFAKNRIDLRSLRELVTAVLRIVLFFLMYQLLPPSIIYVGVVTLIVASVNILFQYKYTKMLLPEMKIHKRNISWSHTKELLASSIWNAINTFGNTLLAGMSMILANMFYGAEASGAYSIVNTVPQFVCGIIVMLVGVFYPVITYKYAQNDKDGLIKEIKNAQEIVGIVGCAVIAIFSALAKEFFYLWTPGEDASCLAILSFFTIIPHFLISCIWPLTNLNVIMNKIKTPAIFTLICGVANIVFAFFVFKIFNPGLISLPIISSGLQFIWIGVFIPIYACKNLKLSIWTFYPTVFKAMVTSIVIMAIVLVCKTQFILTSWVSFMLFGGICGILAIIILSIVVLGPKWWIAIYRKLIQRIG